MNFLTVGSKLNKRILKEAMYLERTLNLSPDEARANAKRMEMETFKADVRMGIECMMEFKSIAAEMGMHDNLKQTWYITIRPDEKLIDFCQFQANVMALVKRKCFKWYFLTFEQKGVTPEDYGKGFHCHIIAGMTQRSKEEVIRDCYSTLKKFMVKECLQVSYLKTQTDLDQSMSYLENYTSKNGHKIITKDADAEWRKSRGLLPFYENACPIKSEGQAVTKAVTTNEKYTVELA